MKQLLSIILTLLVFSCFGTPTKVIRVIDGDTFETETGQKVRLLGINAPEISDIFGQEARQHLTDLINGKTVDLQTDNISNDRDRYSRLLRYVILEGADINRQMISDGFAFAYLKYHFEKATDYKEAQLIAGENNNGMWGNEKKNKAIKLQERKESTSQQFLTKEYFVILLVVTLLMVGIYYYFKSS